jgi:hypothetical protein
VSFLLFCAVKELVNVCPGSRMAEGMLGEPSAVMDVITVNGTILHLQWRFWHITVQM